MPSAMPGALWATFRRPEDLRDMIRMVSCPAYGDSGIGWTTDTLHPDYAWLCCDAKAACALSCRRFQYAAFALAALGGADGRPLH